MPKVRTRGSICSWQRGRHACERRLRGGQRRRLHDAAAPAYCEYADVGMHVLGARSIGRKGVVRARIDCTDPGADPAIVGAVDFLPHR